MVNVNYQNGIFNDSMNSISSAGHRSYRGVTTTDQRPFPLRESISEQKILQAEEAWLRHTAIPGQLRPEINSKKPTLDNNDFWYGRLETWVDEKIYKIKLKYQVRKAKKAELVARERQTKARNKEQECRNEAWKKAREKMMIEHAIDYELARIKDTFKEKDRRQKEEEGAWLKGNIENLSNQERKIFRMGLDVGRTKGEMGRQTEVSSTSTLTLTERDQLERWIFE